MLQEVSRLTPTMYFGELALLRGEARAATVLAAGDCDLLALDRAEFLRVMGPLAAQLEQQAAKYSGLGSAKQVRPPACTACFLKGDTWQNMMAPPVTQFEQQAAKYSTLRMST